MLPLWNFLDFSGWFSLIQNIPSFCQWSEHITIAFVHGPPHVALRYSKAGTLSFHLCLHSLAQGLPQSRYLANIVCSLNDHGTVSAQVTHRAETFSQAVTNEATGLLLHFNTSELPWFLHLFRSHPWEWVISQGLEWVTGFGHSRKLLCNGW